MSSRINSFVKETRKRKNRLRSFWTKGNWLESLDSKEIREGDRVYLAHDMDKRISKVITFVQYLHNVDMTKKRLIEKICEVFGIDDV